MKKYLILACGSFRQRIKMLLLIGVTAGLITLLSCLALLTFTFTGSPAQGMLAFAHTPDLFFIDSSHIRSPGNAEVFWESQEEVERIVRYPVYLDMESNPKVNGETLNNVLFLITESVSSDTEIDQLIPLSDSFSTDKRTVSPNPGPGEIWLTQALCDSAEIEVGDIVEVFTSKGPVQLCVTGIVIDPLFNLPIMNPRRVWVAPGFIASLISQNIQGNYKNIGIFQSIGFTPANIAIVFLIQLLPVFLLFSVIGTAASPGIFKIIISSMLKATGTENPLIPFFPVLGAGTGVSIVTILFTVGFSARKAGMVKTAEAIRHGEAVSDEMKIKSSAKIAGILPVWAGLGIRLTRISGKKSIATGITVFFAVFAAYTAISSLGAMDSLSRKPNFFDTTDSQVRVQRDGQRFAIDHDRLMEDFNSDPDVLRVLGTGQTLASLPQGKYGITKEVPVTILEGDIEAAGIETVYGDNPIDVFSCAVNSKTAAEFDLAPGDTIGIIIEGQSVSFDVSGIFQSMNGMGQGVRITAETMRVIQPRYNPMVYDVFLEQQTDPEEYIRSLTNRFGEGVSARLTSEVSGEFVDTILSSMYTAIYLVSLFFVFIIAAAMISASFYETRTQAKSFTILSLIGFPRKKMLLLVACKMTIIAAIGAVSGLLLGGCLSPLILFLVIKSLGLITIPFFVDIPAAILIFLVSVGLSVFASWLTSVISLRTNIRRLIVE